MPTIYCSTSRWPLPAIITASNGISSPLRTGWPLTTSRSLHLQMLLSRSVCRALECPQLYLWGQPLERVKSYKYLGVTITPKLSWTENSRSVCNKSRRLLGMHALPTVLLHLRLWQTPSAVPVMWQTTPWVLLHALGLLPALSVVWQTTSWVLLHALGPYLAKDKAILEGVQRCV